MISWAIASTGGLIGGIGLAMILSSGSSSITVDGRKGLRAFGALLSAVGTVAIIVGIWVGAIADNWFHPVHIALAAPLIIIGGTVTLVGGVTWMIAGIEGTRTIWSPARTATIIGFLIVAAGLLWGTFNQGWFAS